MELIVFVGLQASGKSSFFRERFAGTHEHVSKDLLRNNRKPATRQTQLIEAALGSGKPVVVDNTNPTPDDRRPLVALGRRYGAKIIGYYFEAGVRGCLERNSRRTGREKVPDVAIYVTADKLVRPSYSEGYDELLSVRLTGSSTFEVYPSPGPAAG